MIGKKRKKNRSCTTFTFFFPGGGVKDEPDDWAPYRGRLSPILKKSKKRRDPLATKARAPSSPSSDESEDEGQKPSTSSTKVKLHFKPLKRAKQLISRLNAERRELRNSRNSDGSTSGVNININSFQCDFLPCAK